MGVPQPLTTLTSLRHPAVKAARRLAAGPARRRGDDLLVEGPQAVGEALERLRRLFVTDEGLGRHRPLVAAARQRGVEVLIVDRRVLAAIAGTVTPQGLVGVASLPQVDLDRALAGARLVVALVEVRDPGNVGTVVRTADAIGADAIVLTAGSVDPRNPKAVRASVGSLFHLPVLRDVSVDTLLPAARAHDLRLVATAPAAPTPYSAVDLTAPTVLLFGSEAHGLPGEVLAACDDAVHVPLYGRAESLNLAATVAVVGYEAVRQRTAQQGTR